MTRIKSIMLACGSVLCSLTIGLFMQYGQTPSHASLSGTKVTLDMVTPTSSGVVTPHIPAKAAPAASFRTPKENQELQQVAAQSRPEPTLDLQMAARPDPSCDIAMTAEPTIGAMAALTLTAPCLPGTQVTLHHGGMALTYITDAQGRIDVDLPVMMPDAVFIAAFENGEGAVAKTNVDTLSDYHRVAVQWEGNTGLQLHALEFGASYFQDGHVWADAQGTPAQTDSGFLVKLGDPSLPTARLAEVYSFPIKQAGRRGTVNLSVEAEITDLNCSQRVAAQTVEIRPDGELVVKDLDLALPGCAAIGEFLVLKNMVEDLKVAMN